MKKWMDMSNLPQEFRERVERLERNFEVSTVIFKKFEPIFFDIFQNPYEETSKPHRSRKQRYFLDLIWLFPGKSCTPYKFMKINFQRAVVSLILKCSRCRATPGPGGCSSGQLGFTSSSCNTGTVPHWECQGVVGRGTMRWVSSKVQWDQHFKRLAEITQVAQECFVLAQCWQGVGIMPWSLCSGGVTSPLPPRCRVFAVVARWVETPDGRKLQLMCSFLWQIWERVVSSSTHTWNVCLTERSLSMFPAEYVAVTAL